MTVTSLDDKGLSLAFVVDYDDPETKESSGWGLSRVWNKDYLASAKELALNGL